jgi:hypothetical protein
VQILPNQPSTTFSPRFFVPPVYDRRVRKKQGILGIVFGIAALALGVAIWQSSRPNEPVYQGKTLSAWLKQLPAYRVNSRGVTWAPLMVNPSTKDELAAEEAVRRIGTNALPVLLQKIQAQDGLRTKTDQVMGWARGLYQRWISRQSPGQFQMVRGGNPPTKADELHWDGGRGLYALGRMAAPAIPELVVLLNSGDNSKAPAAAYALSGMGPEGLAALTNDLPGGNEWTRICVIWAMGQSPTNCAAGLPELMAFLAGTNNVLRMSATWALGRMRAQPELEAPALAANLGDTGFNIRSMTEEALKEYGMTKFTAPALVEYLNDPQPHVRMAATNALLALFPDEAAKAGVK